MIRRLVMTNPKARHAAVESQIESWVEIRRRQADAAEQAVDEEMLISKWREAVDDEVEDYDDVKWAAAQVRGGVAILLAAEPSVGPEAREVLASALRSAVIESVPDRRGPIGGFHEHIPRQFRGRPVPKALQARYPLAVAVTVLGAVMASALIAFGHTRLALLPLTLAVAADLFDGALAKRDSHRRAAGMYTACLASHFMDLVLLGGFVWYLSNQGDPSLALLTGAATTVAIFASFARASALQVGVRIRRSTVERVVRVGGVYTALLLNQVLIAPIALAAFGVIEIAYVLWTVWVSRIHSMAVMVEQDTPSGAKPSWWGWETSPSRRKHLRWGWDTSTIDGPDDTAHTRSSEEEQ